MNLIELQRALRKLSYKLRFLPYRAFFARHQMRR
jgi:hypothetical protein